MNKESFLIVHSNSSRGGAVTKRGHGSPRGPSHQGGEGVALEAGAHSEKWGKEQGAKGRRGVGRRVILPGLLRSDRGGLSVSSTSGERKDACGPRKWCKQIGRAHV